MYEVLQEVESRIIPIVTRDGKLNAVRVTIPFKILDELSKIYNVNLRELIQKIANMKMEYPCKIKLAIDKDNKKPFLIIEIPKVEFKIEFR